MTVLADTGALFALVNRSDSWHQRARTWWEVNREPILVPVTVIPEATYLIATRLGSFYEAAFVRWLGDGDMEMESLRPEDVTRAAALLTTYAELPLGFVDASIVAIAERLDIGTLLTTDRRHFTVVRPAHVPRLRLVP